MAWCGGTKTRWSCYSQKWSTSAACACPALWPAAGLIGRAQELLAEHRQALPLDRLGDELGLSKFHLLRTFQKETWLSPRQWAMQLRTRRAKGLLRKGVAASEVAR
jgi:methylphosphotriester-DNA--protein-cysteine methyltransferase